MSEFHANDEWDEDEEAEPLPFWKRRKWLLIGLGVVVLLVFLFTRGKPHYAPDAPEGPGDPYIGVVVPYQAAKTEALRHRRRHRQPRPRRSRCRHLQ